MLHQEITSGTSELLFQRIRSEVHLITLSVLLLLALPDGIRVPEVHWPAVPGQGIGGLRIGMEPAEVRRLWGDPASTDGTVWTYARPIKARVTFAEEQVLQIESWDTRVRVGSTLAIGTPLPEALKLLGERHVKVQVPRGSWLMYYSAGLGIYIRSEHVAGVAIFPAQHAPVASRTRRPSLALALAGGSLLIGAPPL